MKKPLSLNRSFSVKLIRFNERKSGRNSKPSFAILITNKFYFQHIFLYFPYHLIFNLFHNQYFRLICFLFLTHQQFNLKKILLISLFFVIVSKIKKIYISYLNFFSLAFSVHEKQRQNFS